MSRSIALRGLSRRTLLRGMVGASSIAISLPLLDCFLNSNGTALASGRPLPVRFGTWFWGLGFTPDRWVPKAQGANYDLPPELKYIEKYKSQVSVLSGFDVPLDGKPNSAHYTGNIGFRMGATPAQPDRSELPTIDVLVADAVGAGTRFTSLEMTATGDPKVSYSRRSYTAVNPAEGSPMNLYARIFGAEFQDPNAADFKPDPNVMLKLSVLSGVKDDREKLMGRVGARDKERLDEYFTSLRQIEQQLELQLQKPPPAEACAIPKRPGEGSIGFDVDEVISNHKLMSDLLAMALACNQTKVFNMVFSDSQSRLHKKGSTAIHHQFTHEEMIDKELGYQVQSAWFVERSMEAFATFLTALSAVREGDGTLLDNCLVLAHSDCSFAKTHSINAIPVMLAGKAGGAVKPGLHIMGNGDPVTRIGLTVQQVMGVSADSWGTGAMATNKNIPQILV